MVDIVGELQFYVCVGVVGEYFFYFYLGFSMVGIVGGFLEVGIFGLFLFEVELFIG